MGDRAPVSTARLPAASGIGLAGPLAAVGIVLAAWWITIWLNVVPRAFLPTPIAVAKGIAEIFTTGGRLRDVRESLLGFAVYYPLAAGLGIAVGLALGLVSGLGRFMRPLLGFFNAIAGIAWLPLAMMWFGAGTPTVAFVTANGVFFVVAVNTLTGVQSVPDNYANGLAVLGASRWRIVRDVLLPGAFPTILSGLRLALGFGWRALVAAEMVAAASGLGYLVYRSSYDFRFDIVWAGIVLLGFLSVTLDRLFFTPLERWTVERWGVVHR
jgi:NitT/TauT family transport system permease protein/taurine transport system permease protein